MWGMNSAASASRPTFAQWLEGARPHTWANAFAPVIAGSGAAAQAGNFNFWHALLAALVAWALIVGVNYANDYSDGIKGTDDDRSGPLRLTGSGVARPEAVKRAAFLAFGVAAAAGVVLSLLSAWWLIVVGALCIVAAWFYTGGENPYGYRGLGEVAVFVFFGLVAVLGTQFTQAGRVTWVGLLVAVSVGAMSASVNLINNLRDIPTDTQAGKITLAVRLGDAHTRRLYYVLVGVPLVASAVLAAAVSPWSLLGFLATPFVFLAAKPVRAGEMGRALIPVLGLTGRAMVVWSVVTSLVLGVTSG